jgi:hypothetical protein
MANGLGEMELELEGLGEGAGELDSELEDEFELQGGLQSELEGEPESELEGGLDSEFEFEDEFEGPNPVNRIYPDAMMEHMGLAAMEAESEFEAAEHFLPLIPTVASKLVGGLAKAVQGARGSPNAPRSVAKALAGKKLNQLFRTSKAVTAATPRLTKSVSHLTRALHRNPGTRPLVRLVPSIARRTVAAIAKRAAAGRPVTPATAARILHRQRRHVLGNPKIRRLALRRSGQMDRRFHRLGGFGLLPGAHRGARGPAAHNLGFGASGVPTHGLPPRFHAPGVILAGTTRICPGCGGIRGARRVCCCC